MHTRVTLCIFNFTWLKISQVLGRHPSVCHSWVHFLSFFCLLHFSKYLTNTGRNGWGVSHLECLCTVRWRWWNLQRRTVSCWSGWVGTICAFLIDPSLLAVWDIHWPPGERGSALKSGRRWSRMHPWLGMAKLTLRSGRRSSQVLATTSEKFTWIIGSMTKSLEFTSSNAFVVISCFAC